MLLESVVMSASAFPFCHSFLRPDKFRQFEVAPVIYSSALCTPRAPISGPLSEAAAESLLTASFNLWQFQRYMPSSEPEINVTVRDGCRSSHMNIRRWNSLKTLR